MTDLLPKDLLVDLETGDRTDHWLALAETTTVNTLDQALSQAQAFAQARQAAHFFQQRRLFVNQQGLTQFDQNQQLQQGGLGHGHRQQDQLGIFNIFNRFR